MTISLALTDLMMVICYDDYFINMTVKHNNLLNPIMGCLYVNFVGLHVSVIHMTIIRSVRAKEIIMQQRSLLHDNFFNSYGPDDGHMNDRHM